MGERSSTLEPLTWVSDGFEQIAHGVTGEWSLLPYTSPISPDKPDLWIIRGRRHGGKDWRYFGGYETLPNAQHWAEKFDSQRKLFENLSDRWEDD